MFLKNAGTSSANDVYILLADNYPYNTSLGKGVRHGENWETKISLPNKSGLASQIPIHPGFPTQVATSYEWNPVGHGFYEGKIYPSLPDLNIHMFVYCRDTDQQIFAVKFTRTDFESGEICDRQCRRVSEADLEGIDV